MLPESSEIVSLKQDCPLGSGEGLYGQLFPKIKRTSLLISASNSSVSQTQQLICRTNNTTFLRRRDEYDTPLGIFLHPKCHLSRDNNYTISNSHKYTIDEKVTMPGKVVTLYDVELHYLPEK